MPMPKQKIKTAAEGSKEVDEFITKLEHPLKNEIESVRKIILDSSPHILEQVKWNAPSFRAKDDFVTFHIRPVDKIHLVFHHPDIVRIQSSLLQGDYKDRRMLYLVDQSSIEASRPELQRIIRELVKMMD
jgi:hypothetical protein